MSFYRRWILACTAGELIGIGVATGAGLTVNYILGEPSTLPARLTVLAIFACVGLVEGGALASFEWRVLRTRVPRLPGAPWVAVTAALAVTGWLVGMTPSPFLTQNDPAAVAAEPPMMQMLVIAAAGGAVAGALFGATQWMLLRRYVSHAASWIWIHIPAWAAAMVAIFLGAMLPNNSTPGWLIAISGVSGGVLGGLLLGSITGLVARGLTPKQRA